MFSGLLKAIKEEIYVETGSVLTETQMGRSLKIGSLSNGFITLAGGSMIFCGKKIH